MNFLRKITDNHIIKVELISVLSDQVLQLAPLEGHFSKTDLGIVVSDGVYFTVDSPQFTESGKPTAAGYQYLQEFSFKTPANSDRIEYLRRFRYLKAIRIHFCNGRYVDLGRNDYHQNHPITGEFETDKNFTRIAWQIQTIFPFQFIE